MRCAPGGGRIVVALLFVVASASPSLGSLLPGGGSAASDCYVVLRTQGQVTEARSNRLECTDGDPECDQDGDCHNGSCTFGAQVCINQDVAGCEAPAALQKLQIGPSKLGIPAPPTLRGAACGEFGDIVVPLGKRRTRPGKSVITLKAKPLGAKGKDADKDSLVCLPRAATDSCPTTTTTVTSLPGKTSTTIIATTSTMATGATTSTTTLGGTTSTTSDGSSTTTTTTTGETSTTSVGGTTTTTVASLCAPIVVGQAIPNTYKLQGTTGEKRCTTNAAANRFGTCNSDAGCGNTAGACLPLPWVTADGQVMSFPTGSETTFKVAASGAFPACEHGLCIPCGNPNAACRGIPGCEVAGNPNGCVARGTQGCCDQPGFVVPTFFVNILGGLCSRVDQIDCGVGVVNTSNPQTGDNEVTKKADTSDPGPDCAYGTGDDPAALPCTVAGAGNDYKGKIARTIGDGNADADGIQYRLTTPELSTTWSDSQSPQGTCANGSTFDNDELLVSQIVLKAEPTTAGASGSFVDLNGDGCKRAGNGFITSVNAATDGPITVPGAPAGPGRPQPYDGSAGSVAAAVSEVFSGPNSPIKDIGFVAITPNLPAVVVPSVSCSCTPVAGCPE